jgi:lysyl-tRNA synthetase class 2
MTDIIGPGQAEPGSGQQDSRSAVTQVARARDGSGQVQGGGDARFGRRQGDPQPRPVDRRHQRRWVPRIAGLVVLAVGLSFISIGMESGLYRQFHQHLHPHGRLQRLAVAAPDALGLTSSITRTALVVIGLLLLMLSHGLRRRKRRAWVEAMALLGIGAVVDLIRLLRHIDAYMHNDIPVGLAITAVLIAFGWYYRKEFYAVGDPRTRWRALGVFVGLLTADVVIGLAYIAPQRLHGSYDLVQQVQSVLYGLVGDVAQGPVQFSASQDTRSDFFTIMTAALGFLTVLVTAYLFLRPAEPEGRLGAKDEVRVRALLDKYGEADSLGYFALRRDKSVIWSPTGKSCIGYRVLSGVMLASGDPLGDVEAWPGAIGAFLDLAARHAWLPAVVGCSERGAEVWCREGNLTALELGDEAVVDVAAFSLQGRTMRNVRQMVTRVERAGYVAQIRRVGDVPAAELQRLVRQADSWRGSPTERGFSMALGRIGGSGDQRCVVATATEGGVLRALLHFVPWGDDGLSLDLMRRDRSAQPGLNDFMIVEVIKAAQDLGVKRISLNFAVFRAALERGERIGAGPIVRAWRGFLLFLSRWFQIESLYKFNAKFAPQWVPRFMVFTGTRDAIRIGLAALEAEAFLIWPTFELHRIGRKMRATLRHRRSGAAGRADEPGRA